MEAQDEDYCVVFHTDHSDETVMIPPAGKQKKKSFLTRKISKSLDHLEAIMNIFLVMIKLLN